MDLEEQKGLRFGTVTDSGTLEGGWFLVSEAPSTLSVLGDTEYLVSVHKRIGERFFECTLKSHDPIQRDNTLAMCKTLRAK